MVQERKALEAKHAAAKANLARLKKQDELMKRQAENKLRLLKIQQEKEQEKLLGV